MASNHSDSDENDIEIEEDDEGQHWNSDWETYDDGVAAPDMLCLFCENKYISSDVLFNHLITAHEFNFHEYTRGLGLDFYSCFKFINYVRSTIADIRSWTSEDKNLNFKRMKDLIDNLPERSIVKGSNFPWDDDKYLTPFMNDDSLLYNFEQNLDDGEIEDDVKNLSALEKICIEDGIDIGLDLVEKPINSIVEKTNGNSSGGSSNGENLRRSFKIPASEIKIVDKNYFGSYSSFGIHREMLSDKVRTDAYEQAICKNPSLLEGAVVLDVGCGTGILSFFAAKAGASNVTAVDGSEKMAAVATQIAKDNGYSGKVRVLHSMIEALEHSQAIQPQSIDVIVSEWMGYCLLYESMLSSVLFARDKWLKPGGAILPDTATMFAAGFGRGCTSLPFWENVYGLNMSSVGKELVEEASHFPIVDVVDSRDIVTNTAVLQDFDLVSMTVEEMDFTSTIELEAKEENLDGKCYGIVVWFDTGFTDRFCKETPTVLSTSPYIQKTHWSQTILTFREPITLGSGKVKNMEESVIVGSDACPASKIRSRISIVRGGAHRSIDISLENVAISHDGRKRTLPVQMFALD
ncbi:probable protein arginine N-methyltransferase 3 [Impatiens glandulifera]|uniref:probable protein arginine N-methyltransferase 3 n=1 Tax=Impatiens glandulifera TaxID=253017 RepID=UPI001FB18B10|nr:probable protein arginine N-methyltransferase 3 [Impatiens glandulifera]